MSVADLLRLHAGAIGGKAAIISRDGEVSYAALDRMVDGVCHALVARGVARGDLVGVSLEDDARHLAVLLALGRMGAVLLPIDRRWLLGESLNVADRFGARFVVTDRDDAPMWTPTSADWFEGDGGAYMDPLVTDDLPMVMSLSSGTTGLPKGPLLTHRQFVSRFMVYWINIGLGSRDRFVVATPLYFGGGRTFALAMIFAGGTACLFAPPYEPGELIDFTRQVDGTAMFLVPTIMRRLLAQPLEGLAFPELRALISSGSALYASEAVAVRRKLTPNLYQYYASTEAGGVTLLTPEDHETRAGSVGRPVFAVRVEVVDDAHHPLPAESIGQLRYRGPASPDKYHLGEGAAAFHDGWFYPGDLASFDAEGFLYLRGRAKDMIIRGGVNIYPADIETVLLAMDAVAEAAVVGYSSPQLGEEIAAFVVRKGVIEEAELRAACLAGLARYKVPKRFVFLDQLPKNGSGKILKTELSKMVNTP